MKKEKTQMLAMTGVMLALAAVLSMIKVFEMPLGGSITLLSMLPIVFLSLRYGVKWGLCSAFLYSLIQLAMDAGKMASWGLSKEMLIGSVIFDYIIAFTVLGLAGIWSGKGRVLEIAGVSLAMALRFVSHVISGTIFFASWSQWDNVFLYSICYNGLFMLPELVLTCGVLIAVPAVLKLVHRKNV